MGSSTRKYEALRTEGLKWGLQNRVRPQLADRQTPQCHSLHQAAWNLGALTGTPKSELACHLLRDSQSPACWDLLSGDLGYPMGPPHPATLASEDVSQDVGDLL